MMEKPYEPLEANSKDASNLSIANQYFETILGTAKETFVEAMQVGHVKHHDNECFINAFIDHYEYTLMKDNMRNILTLEKIIMLMGNKEQSFITEGATLKHMEPIFVKYRLQARVFDTVTKHILYTYDPPCPDCHAKPRCCMMKNNHSYVLKYDLK